MKSNVYNSVRSDIQRGAQKRETALNSMATDEEWYYLMNGSHEKGW